MENLYANSTLYTLINSHFGIASVFLIPAVAVLILWTLVLKGFGLWYAARNGQRNWFIAMLVINAVGITELIYLVWFRKDRSGVTPSLFETENNGTVAEPTTPQS
jgi:hypothetical protein